MVYPSNTIAPLAASDMPPSVQEYYDEARSIASLSPRAAAALLRIAAKKLCEELGEDEKNLYHAIGNLKKQGLPEEIIRSLDAVRIVGNEGGAHEGQIDLTSGDNEKVVGMLFELVNFIVEKTISDEKRIKEISEWLPENQRKAVTNRDNSAHSVASATPDGNRGEKTEEERPEDVVKRWHRRGMSRMPEEIKEEMAKRIFVRCLIRRLPTLETAGDFVAAAEELQERMPQLAMRDTTSKDLQQYSTPLPIAAAVQSALKLWERQRVLEPSAGNGTLVTSVPAANVVAHELDPMRADFLEDTLGIRTHRSSSTERSNLEQKVFDAVIANPPFSAKGDPDSPGKLLTWPLSTQRGKDEKNRSTSRIDFGMAAAALSRLDPSTGVAGLILAGPHPTELKKSEQERRVKYAEAETTRNFYNFLHEEFKVVGHYTVDGNLYRKQGPSRPVDIVLVDQMAEKTVPLPFDRAPEVLATTADLRRIMDSETKLGAEVAAGANERLKNIAARAEDLEKKERHAKKRKRVDIIRDQERREAASRASGTLPPVPNLSDLDA